jgi:hypothetical protein
LPDELVDGIRCRVGSEARAVRDVEREAALLALVALVVDDVVGESPGRRRGRIGRARRRGAAAAAVAEPDADA